MTMYLGEEWVGIDNDLVYPNVQSCVALAVESSDGDLGGAHLTVGTRSADLQKIAMLLIGSLHGKVNRVFCLGNKDAFGKHEDKDMRVSTGLRATLQSAFAFNGNVQFYDTFPLYVSTRPANSSSCGVFVRVWFHDGPPREVRFAVGPYTAGKQAGSANVDGPIYSTRHLEEGRKGPFGSFNVQSKRNKKCPIYQFTSALADVPLRDFVSI